MAINITSDDPMTAGYDAVWAILAANTTWASAVKRKNNWDDGTLETPLTPVRTGQLPEVSLVQGAFSLSPTGSNSKIVEIQQVYTIVSVSDTLQVATVNALKWATLAAFRANPPEDVTWNTRPFCKGFMLTNGSDGTGGIRLPGMPSDAARGIDRLVSIVAVTLQLYCAASLLPA